MMWVRNAFKVYKLHLLSLKNGSNTSVPINKSRITGALSACGAGVREFPVAPVRKNVDRSP